MIFDSHTHINVGKDTSTWKKLMEENKLGMLVNTASAQEYNFVRNISKNENLYISFGIHPWDIEKVFWGKTSDRELEEHIEKMMPSFMSANAIGEIGMDNVWCECDLELQRKVFIKQMEIAQRLKKPVVLHTKGQEREIAEIIKDYDVRKLIHWYSCGNYLDNYITQDCYFTVGPDFEFNDNVKTIIEKVPAHRLLVETDGIEAVKWAINEHIDESDVPKLLRRTIMTIAKEKKLAKPMAEYIMEENFSRFIKAV